MKRIFTTTVLGVLAGSAASALGQVPWPDGPEAPVAAPEAPAGGGYGDPANPRFPAGVDPLHPPGTPEGFMLVEGDILIPDDPFGSRSYEPGSAWPGGIIPFDIDTNLTASEQAALFRAMWEMSSTEADISFVLRSDQLNYVSIIRSDIPNVSYSQGVGMDRGRNILAINDDHWDSTFIIVHELMHRVGFYHEQSRPDRDQYVRIERGNISADGGTNFDLEAGSDTLGTPYDYLSIMHYGACSFSECSSCSSSNASCRTITTLNPAYQSAIGNRDAWGPFDRVDLRLVYGFGSCVYAKGGASAGMGTLEQPFGSANIASVAADGGTVWCERGTTLINSGTLSAPCTLKSHGPGTEATLR